ncbi:AfsR/SARP family transcriptional regulator, partial [Streptomyces jumonjinensis]|uniref:AfsR/SARP family transcriptional regulator n=1 Tax=Streptomyces jumonjinensis TaxID=1945 RepID=UPI0037913885
MRISVLGTTQALQGDGTPVALGGARLRALLTVLAIRPGRAVPVGRIVAEVWAGDPPADAPGAVQALVGRLRRALGRDAVASAEGGGYLLCAEADDVDLHRFDRLAGDGARALGQGDAAKAAGLLDEALGLWRGPVLADLPDRAAPAARWEARRLDARRTRLTAALDLGSAAEALPELTALCADHPIDEPLQALRLRALAVTGRPAEALAAYDVFRRRLAARLGTDPGPALRALHRELLAPDCVTAPAQPPTDPDPTGLLRGAPGSGLPGPGAAASGTGASGPAGQAPGVPVASGASGVLGSTDPAPVAPAPAAQASDALRSSDQAPGTPAPGVPGGVLPAAGHPIPGTPAPGGVLPAAGHPIPGTPAPGGVLPAAGHPAPGTPAPGGVLPAAGHPAPSTPSPPPPPCACSPNAAPPPAPASTPTTT